MKVKKMCMRFVSILIFALCVLFSSKTNTYAESIKSGTIKLNSQGSNDIEFKINEPSIVTITLDIRLANKNSYTLADKFDVCLRKSYFGKNIEKDTFSLYDGYSNEVESACFYYSQVLQPRVYYYVFESDAVHDLIFDYEIQTYPSIAESFQVKQTVSLVAGKEKIIKVNAVPSNSFLTFDKISCSNNKIAEGYWDQDKIYIYARKTGNCKIKVTSTSGYSRTIKLKVTNPKKPKLMFKDYTMYTGNSVNNILWSDNKNTIWTSANTNIATVDKNGKIYAKGVGKTTITAKSGTKKYICKITVLRQEPDFNALLEGYYTRDNYFTVLFTNKSDKPLTIYPSNARVMNVDYKSFDRNLSLKGGKTLIIKPYKSVLVKFYVKGRVTWYDYKDYTLEYKFAFDGKQYTGRVWDNNSIYKKTSWYTTFWDKEAYEYWLSH